MRWDRPTKEIKLENSRVLLSFVDLDSDLVELFDSASFYNNTYDLFRYHVNIPEMKNLDTFREYLQKKNELDTEVLFKIYSKRLKTKVGCFSLMNINVDHGCLEIGSVWISESAQKSEVNTNVMLLIFTHIFEVLKFRRLEWKCNNENEDSKRAAVRLGFTFEGLFRNHMISRGKNRDTAWFSITDTEWETRKINLTKLANLSLFSTED